MEILGTRTQIAFREGGAALNLGDPAEDDPPKVVEYLIPGPDKSRHNPGPDESRIGGFGGGHRRWQYTALASVVHLLSNKI